MTAGVVPRASAAFYRWYLLEPPGNATEVAELSEFRGRILHANGRRPLFSRPEGGFADDDPLDMGSFHVTVRTEGELVACIRIRPLPEHAKSSLTHLVTPAQLEGLLEGMRLAHDDCVEVGRWIVAPSVRGTAVARTLVVSCWAVARWLGKQCMLVTAGARDGQVIMLSRFGGQVLHAFHSRFLTEYDDEVSPMYFDLNQPPLRVTTQLESVEQLLNLRDRADRSAEFAAAFRSPIPFRIESTGCARQPGQSVNHSD
jgi:predicted GNAT family N-acyltransferase